MSELKTKVDELVTRLRDAAEFAEQIRDGESIEPEDLETLKGDINDAVIDVDEAIGIADPVPSA